MVSSPPLPHRVARVEGEVHDHLLHLAVVRLDAAQARAQARDQGDVLAQERPEHPLHALDHPVEAQHLARDDPVPAEAEELPGEVHRALGGLPDLVGVAPADVVRPRARRAGSR